MDLSNLIVQAQPWQWIALLGVAIGMTGLLYGWGGNRPRPIWLLALIRFGVLGTLCFFLLNPMLRSTTETRESPVLPVLVDATSSQWLGRDSTNRREALDALVSDLPLWGQTMGWEVALFEFDRDVRELAGASWSPTGKRTDLGRALESMRDRYIHRNVPAVVVVTDGRANRGPDPEFTAERLDVPHMFVGTGDTAMVTDLELSKLRLNDVAYLGNAFPIEVTAKARGASGLPLTLKLASETATLASTTWTPKHDMSSTQWTVQVDALKAGPMTLRALVEAPDPSELNEVTLQNNAARATIEVLESRRKILVVAATPHPDVAALRNAASTNVHQETEVVWVADLNAGANLPEHDVLVLHQVTPTLLPSSVIDAIQSSRSVWILGGASTTWNDWDLELIGFQHDPEPLITEAQGNAVNPFELFPLPSELDQMLAMWPPLACPTGSYRMTPALRPALQQKVGPVNTDWPLWALREDDTRRVAITLGEGLWRWRMQDLIRHDGESKVFDELVNRTLQYLSSRDDVNRLRIAGPERIDEDLRCQFVAEVYDASLSPTTEADVSLDLVDSNGSTTRHRFIENTMSTDFELDLGMLLPGVYSWTATCLQSGEQLIQRGTLIVNSVQAEASLIPANHRLLHRLADRTSGAFLGTLQRPDDVTNLKQNWENQVSSFQTQDVVHTSSERLPLHAQIWLLVAMLVMLTSEWSIRRLGGGR